MFVFVVVGVNVWWLLTAVTRKACVTVSLGAGELQQLLVPVGAVPVPTLATRLSW